MFGDVRGCSRMFEDVRGCPRIFKDFQRSLDKKSRILFPFFHHIKAIRFQLPTSIFSFSARWRLFARSALDISASRINTKIKGISFLLFFFQQPFEKGEVSEKSFRQTVIYIKSDKPKY